jgi:hypothetical protein
MMGLINADGLDDKTRDNRSEASERLIWWIIAKKIFENNFPIY